MISFSAWQRSMGNYASARRRARLAGPKRSMARIRCSGKIHVVSWTEFGSIVAHDHTKDELEAMRTFKNLGDQQCQCLDMVDSLRNGRSERREFRDLVNLQRKIRANRGARSIWHNDDFQPKQKKSRSYSMPEKMVHEAKSTVCHKIATYFSSGHVHYPGLNSEKSRGTFGQYKTETFVGFTQGHRVDEMLVMGEPEFEVDKKTGRKTGKMNVNVVTSLSWLTLNAIGLGVVDGMLVAGIVARGGATTVIVGRVIMDRETGFKPTVKSWVARVELGDDKLWHVAEWIRPSDLETISRTVLSYSRIDGGTVTDASGIRMPM